MSTSAPPRRLPLAAAALLVPTVLAGLTLLWPRPQMEADLATTATQALDAAGLDAAEVAFAGRDATISGADGADGQRAVEVVEAVTGVRVARLAGDGAAPPPGPPAWELDPAAKAALQAEIDALVAASPLTFRPDSPALTPAGERTVQRIVALLAAVPGVRVQVDGFVAAGPGRGELTAQELSDLRARTVRDALVAGGVPADRVSTTGRGEGDVPVARDAGRRAAVTVI